MKAAGTALILACCMGCGSAGAPEIPGLLEPVAINSAYRPVERGNIGNVEVISGTVVPADYPSFFRTNVTVAEITVEVGDYVEEGQVIAYADLSEARESKKELEEQLSQENTTYGINCRIAELQEEKLGIERLASEAIGDREGMEALDSALEVSRENARYDGRLHLYRVKKLEEAIAKQQAIIDDGTLRASHSGYVTQVKNYLSSRVTVAMENLVTISDYENPYIELALRYSDYAKYQDYEMKYIKFAGVDYPVEEIAYSSDELILAKATGRFPRVRIACPQGVDLSIGMNCPVYYVYREVKDVLLIGLDSLNSEGDSVFVYVKTGQSDKERREISTGERDKHYVEVTEGLEEGELVFYQSESKMPETYTEYTVGLSDFSVPSSTNSYEKGDSLVFDCTSEHEGRIVELAVEEGDEVKEGDLLYVIDTGEGKAALTEAKQNIDRENEEYLRSCEETDKLIQSLDQQMASPEPAAPGNEIQDQENEVPDPENGIPGREEENPRDPDVQPEAPGAADANAWWREMLACDRQIALCQKQLSEINHENSKKSLQEAYDRLKKNNDGTGKVSVYAPHSGKVHLGIAPGADGIASVAVGDKVMQGDLIVSIAAVSGDNILVNVPEDLANLGEQVIIETEGKNYTATCIGAPVCQANGGRVLLGTDADGPYVSMAEVGVTFFSGGFYIKVDDESFYEEMPEGIVSFSYIALKDVVVVPESLVQYELSKSGEEGYYYVWKLVDGQLVKQYVLTDEQMVSSNQRVILSGLTPGDVIASE